jgi:hypothetical protein
MTPTRYSPAIAAAFLVAISFLFARAAADAGEDISDCSIAQTAFSECTGYVTGVDDKVSPQCCRGLDDVKDLAPTEEQRRDLCACILSEMLAAGKVNSGRATALPAACGLRDVAFVPTSPDFDCSRYVHLLQHAPLGLICCCFSLFSQLFSMRGELIELLNFIAGFLELISKPVYGKDQE